MQENIVGWLVSIVGGVLLGLGLWRQAEVALGRKRKMGGVFWKFAGIACLVLALYLAPSVWIWSAGLFLFGSMVSIGAGLLVRKSRIG